MLHNFIIGYMSKEAQGRYEKNQFAQKHIETLNPKFRERLVAGKPYVGKITKHPGSKAYGEAIKAMKLGVKGLAKAIATKEVPPKNKALGMAFAKTHPAKILDLYRFYLASRGKNPYGRLNPVLRKAYPGLRVSLPRLQEIIQSTVPKQPVKLITQQQATK